MSACVGAHLRRGLSLRTPRAARFGVAWRRGPSAARLGLRVVRFDEVWIVRACQVVWTYQAAAAAHRPELPSGGSHTSSTCKVASLSVDYFVRSLSSFPLAVF